MHIMNAMVAAVNAYQHYQRDVERSYHEIEASTSATKTHTHNQAADVQVSPNPPLFSPLPSLPPRSRVLAATASTCPCHAGLSSLVPRSCIRCRLHAWSWRTVLALPVVLPALGRRGAARCRAASTLRSYMSDAGCGGSHPASYGSTHEYGRP